MTATSAIAPTRGSALGAGDEASRTPQGVAFLAAVAVGCKLDLAKGLTAGVLVLVVLLPVWWPVLRTSRWLRGLAGTAVLALVVGYGQSWLAATTRQVDWTLGAQTTSLVLVAFVGPAVLVWAATVIPIDRVVLGVGSGSLLFTVATPAIWVQDPWKFGFQEPVSLLILAVVAGWTRRRGWGAGPGIGGVAVIAAISGVSNFRSGVGFAALTLGLLLWQVVAVRGGRRLRAASPALLLVAGGLAVYLVASQLFLGGVFGSAVQQRSQEQIRASGTLLLGGRPEWSATVQLLAERPAGYGLAVLADSRDVQLAVAGFESIHVDPGEGYVAYIQKYMLTGGFHLHSTAADLWAACGPLGFVLAGLAVALAVSGMSLALASGRASPALVLTVVWLLWNVAFNPLYASTVQTAVALFLAVEAIRARVSPTPAATLDGATP